MPTRPDDVTLPHEFQLRRLSRRAAQVSPVMAVVVLVAVIGSGLGEMFGEAPEPVVVLIGELRVLVPSPGRIGGIDGGLVRTLMSTAAAAELTVAAVLAYRLILFSLPLAVGVTAIAPRPQPTRPAGSLRRADQSVNGGAPWRK